MPFVKRLCLGLALLLPLPMTAQTNTSDETPAPTQAEAVVNGQKFGAWNVTCVAVAVGETNCTLTQRILRATDNAFVADLIATRNAENDNFLIARVPVGAYLPTGFAMRDAKTEDEEDVQEFVWQSCNREFCEALLQLDEDTATALSADENRMIAAFRPSRQNEPFVFQFSLNGLVAGLDAVTR